MPSREFRLKPYGKHILFCVGDKCAHSEESLKVYEYLKTRLVEKGLSSGDERVLRSKTTCLGVCAKGPVVVVYPEGIWYFNVDRKKVEKIVDCHCAGSEPLEEGASFLCSGD